MIVYVAIFTEDFEVIGIYNNEDDLIRGLCQNREFKRWYKDELEDIIDADDMDNVKTIEDFARDIVDEGGCDGLWIETKIFE